jgi:hypothetical protein
MNYEAAAEKYIHIRSNIEALEKAHKVAKAELTEKLYALEQWFTAKSQEDGLPSIPTTHGLVYWSTHHSASVASREDFFAYCKEHDTWDMVESRAMKTGVKSFIEANGAPPPGVNFSSIQVFNFRKAPPKVS